MKRARARCVGVLVALLSGCADPGSPGTPAPPPPLQQGAELDGFTMTVTTDRSSYAAEETVVVAVEVCSTAEAPQVTSSGGGTDLLYDFRVLDDEDAVVADSSHAVRTMELRRVDWGPQECRSATTDWDGRYWNRDPGPATDDEGQEVFGLPVRGEPIPAGSYRVEASWLAGDWDDPPRDRGTAASEPFEVSGS